MGTSLNGLTPANTYQALIKVGNNTNLNTTLKTLSDGAGNDLPMQASTTGINFTGTVSGVASGVSGAIQFSNGSAFASDAANFFWDNTNKRLGIGTNAPVAGPFQVKTTQSNANGSIIFTNNTTATILAATDTGSALTQLQFRASSYNFTDTAGMRIASTGYATTPTAMLQIVGSGSTSATTSLLVQNSAGTSALSIKDDLSATFGGNISASNLSLPSGGAIYAGTQLRIGSGAITILSDSANSINFAAGSSGRSFGVSSAINGGPNSTAFLFVGDTATGVTMGSNSNSHASAVLDLVSTTKGFLPPRMTTAQKNAISSPATGLQVFDSTMNATCEYTGTAWRVVSAGAQAVTVTGLLQTVSLADGNVLNITLNSTTTFTFTNPTIGTYILKLTQGVGGGFLVNWPVSVIWSGGTAPTLSTTAGKIDIITLIYDGTSYYGNYSLNY